MSSTSLSRISPQDSDRTNERYGCWEGVIPLPPDGLMWSVGGATLENYLVVADAWGQVLSPLLASDASVLDVGCGCGRAARVLLPSHSVQRYIGFDLIPENIAWCNRFITPLYPDRAVFLHYDLHSSEYNPSGAIRSSELVFPCADGSIDLAVAASVFTHLLEPDAIHYLNEVSRALSNRGRAVLSIHTAVAPGLQFCGNESRIDIDPEYFTKLAAGAGLVPRRVIPDLGGQMVFIFCKC